MGDNRDYIIQSLHSRLQVLEHLVEEVLTNIINNNRFSENKERKYVIARLGSIGCEMYQTEDPDVISSDITDATMYYDYGLANSVCRIKGYSDGWYVKLLEIPRYGPHTPDVFGPLTFNDDKDS